MKDSVQPFLFPVRLFNFSKLLFSYILSFTAGKPLHVGFPVHISIEPSNHCNLRCQECPTGQRGLTRPSGSINFGDFKRYLDQFTPYVSRLALYFQGEPYLNREVYDCITYARDRDIFVWTSTNGHFLTEENIRKTIESGLSKLIISVDGTDQAVYEQYRTGGSLQTVLEGIRRLVRIRREMNARNPILEIQFLVLKSNEHQIREIRNLGKSLGVERTVLKTAQFYNFEHGNPLIPENERWSRYRRSGGQKDITAPPNHGTTESPLFYFIRNPLHNRCFRMWSGCVITWDGKVVPCCFDKDADHCLGDMNIRSFKEIWGGEKYRQFRDKIFKSRRSVGICRNCSQRW